MLAWLLSDFRGSGPVLLRNPIFSDFSGGPDSCMHVYDTHNEHLCQQMLEGLFAHVASHLPSIILL